MPSYGYGYAYLLVSLSGKRKFVLVFFMLALSFLLQTKKRGHDVCNKVAPCEHEGFTPAKVPHVEVLEHVSSILKEFGLCPSKDCIDVRNLRPYNCKISFIWLRDKGYVDATKEPALHAAVEKAVRKKLRGGWGPTYTRRSFFPCWRSVLAARCKLRVYPSYASADYKYKLDLEQIRNRIRNESTCKSRTYSTAAFKALAKVLKNA